MSKIISLKCSNIGVGIKDFVSRLVINIISPLRLADDDDDWLQSILVSNARAAKPKVCYC